MWDVGVERQVEIVGGDALRFVELLTPREVESCAVGQCKFVLNTDGDGGIINNPVLLRLGENHFWLSVADGDVLLWAKGVAAFCGMDVDVREPDVAPVQVQGPSSGRVVARLLGEGVLDIPYYWMEEFRLGGMELIVSRTGYTGELGFEVYLKEASRWAGRLWEAVLEAGKPEGIAVTGPCQIRRVEAGILSYGSDIALDNNAFSDYGFLNPYEAGLEYTVDLDKESPFIGRSALERIAEEGVRRRVVGVEVGGDPITGYIEDYLPVLDDGARIGQVSSVFYSPRLRKNVGFALVPTEYSEPGTWFVVDTATGGRDARVVPKPFIDPAKEIPRAPLRERAGGN